MQEVRIRYLSDAPAWEKNDLYQRRRGRMQIPGVEHHTAQVNSIKLHYVEAGQVHNVGICHQKSDQMR